MHDPYAVLREQLLREVLQGPGESAPAVRQAAAANAGLPQELQPLVRKIHAHAYQVTDEDVARVQADHGDDETFEIIVSAALGASRHRLRAGIAALEDA